MKRLFLPLIIIVCIAPVLMQCEKQENIDVSKEIQWATYTTLDGLVSNNVLSISIDEEGNKWFGTITGVSKFDGATWTNYTTKDGLGSYDDLLVYVRAIAIDKEGNKWFGTDMGVSKFDGTTWTNYTIKDGLISGQVQSIAIDKEGNKWFGTLNGVSKYDGTTWTNYTTENGLVSDIVLAIAIDQYDYKWFGTWEGVTMFTGINWRSYRTNDGLSSDYVTSIAIDRLNNKWFGTASYGFYNGGISKFDGGAWTKIEVNASGDNGFRNDITAIAIDKQANIWIAEEHLIIYEPFAKFGHWEGGGVSKFDGKTWTHYTTSDGLVSNHVLSIAIDKEGNKWFGTDMGVSKLSD